MNIKTSIVYSLLFLSVGVFAQNEEVLTNKSVTDLVKAGLDNSIIISKIESSTCKFDVSTNSLIALKKANVPSDIIKAMVDKSSSVSKSDKPIPTAPKDEPQLTTLSEINQYDPNTKDVKPLEKAKARMVVKGVLAQTYVFELDGTASPVRASTNAPEFIVRMTEAQGDPAAWFTLYKAESKKDKRIATWVKALATGKNATSNVMEYSVKQLSSGVFEIIPSKKFEKGEYFFVAKGSLAGYNQRAADVFAFGID